MAYTRVSKGHRVSQYTAGLTKYIKGEDALTRLERQPPVMRQHFESHRAKFKRNTKCICRTKSGWHYQHPLCPVHEISTASGYSSKSATVPIEEGRYRHKINGGG